MHDPDLWSRLQSHAFDDPRADAPFSTKLAYAEQWTDAYTARVIEEYRKFLYLTQVTRHQITPSVPVDRAWHMHLTFTQDYWDTLCGSVIGKAVHHKPCLSEDEMSRYRQQYVATRALYEREFGVPPPDDIWPDDATADPIDLLATHFGLGRVLLYSAPFLTLGLLLSIMGAISVPPGAFFFGLVGVMMIGAAIGNVRQSKYRQRRSTRNERPFYAFEFGGRGGSDGGGDGDGGGGCGD